MKTVLAQRVNIGNEVVEGPLKGINTIGDLVSKVMEFATPLALVILFFVFAWGGYDLLLSQGKPDKIRSAKAKFTTGIIGFALVVSAYIVAFLLKYIFNLGNGAI